MHNLQRVVKFPYYVLPLLILIINIKYEENVQVLKNYIYKNVKFGKNRDVMYFIQIKVFCIHVETSQLNISASYHLHIYISLQL